MTNNHVLPDPETASRSLAEFDYELDSNFVERRGRIFPFAPMDAFYTSVELDVTIVAISPMGHDGTPITDFGVLPLIPTSGKGITGEYVSIIQHPEGGTKQVVVRENQIIALDQAKFPNVNSSFMHYTADTERGSSGSPVFNDQWDLVAIHHLAIVDRDDKGQPLNKRGKVWTAADGEDGQELDRQRRHARQRLVGASAGRGSVQRRRGADHGDARLRAARAPIGRARAGATMRRRRRGRRSRTFPTPRRSRRRASPIAAFAELDGLRSALPRHRI